MEQHRVNSSVCLIGYTHKKNEAFRREIFFYYYYYYVIVIPIVVVVIIIIIIIIIIITIFVFQSVLLAIDTITFQHVVQSFFFGSF